MRAASRRIILFGCLVDLLAGCGAPALGDESPDAPVRIVTNQKGDDFDGWLGPVLGVADRGGKVRLYYNDRTGEYRTLMIESADLRSWSEPIRVQVTDNPSEHPRRRGVINVFYHDGWKGYISGHGSMHLLTSDDGVTFRHVGKAFDWKMDTQYSCRHDGKRYVMYGRVRGNRAGAGGWEGGVDRRGISMHTSPRWAGGAWKSKVLADPADYFDYTKPQKPDFYTPHILPDGTGFTAVFWRDERRVPDRRPQRITGEVYSIRTRVRDGRFEIISTDPVIPRRFHLRKSAYPRPTSSKREIGQLHVYPAIVKRNGGRYVFYFYRDDTHYEAREDGRHETSVYLYRLK